MKTEPTCFPPVNPEPAENPDWTISQQVCPITESPIYRLQLLNDFMLEHLTQQPMQLRIERKPLLAALEHLSKVIEKKQTMPIFSQVAIQVEHDDKYCELVLRGNDTEIDLQLRVPVLQHRGYLQPICLEAHKLKDLLKRLKHDETVELSYTLNKNRASLTGKRHRFDVMVMQYADYPVLDIEHRITTVTVNPDTIEDALAPVSFAAAKQDVRYYLNGVSCELSDGNIYLTATDGHRLAIAHIQDEAIRYVPYFEVRNQSQCILPNKTIKLLQYLLQKFDCQRLNLTVLEHNRIKIQSEHFVLRSRLIDGCFPDWRGVVPAESNAKTRVELNKTALLDDLQTVDLLSNEKYRGVRIGIEQHAMQLAAHNAEQETAYVDIDYAQCTGDDMEFGASIRYLVDALKHLNTERVCMTLTRPNDSMKITEVVEETHKDVKLTWQRDAKAGTYTLYADGNKTHYVISKNGKAFELKCNGKPVNSIPTLKALKPYAEDGYFAEQRKADQQLANIDFTHVVMLMRL